MNKYLAGFVVLALACFTAASTAQASDDLESALARSPNEDKETKDLDRADRFLAPFCVAYRDYIINGIKNMEERTAVKMAKLVYPETPFGLKFVPNEPTTMQQVYDNEDLCDQIAEYKRQLHKQLEQFLKGVSGTGKRIVSIHRTHDCVTPRHISDRYLQCLSVKGSWAWDKTTNEYY